jgi:hypothetical protein
MLLTFQGFFKESNEQSKDFIFRLCSRSFSPFLVPPLYMAVFNAGNTRQIRYQILLRYRHYFSFPKKPLTARRKMCGKR